MHMLRHSAVNEGADPGGLYVWLSHYSMVMRVLNSSDIPPNTLHHDGCLRDDMRAREINDSAPYAHARRRCDLPRALCSEAK